MSAFRVAVRRFPAFESAIGKQWDAFEAVAHSGLTLELAPLDLHPLHQAIFHSAEPWDVVFLNTDWVLEAADSNTLLDLAPYLKSDPPEGYPGAWSDSLLRFQQVDTRVLGLPYHDGPECLIYRRDLFEEAGLPAPSTWEQFHTAARHFTNPARGLWGSVFAAYRDGHNLVYDFCLQLWTRGSDLSGLRSAAAQDALRFYRGILRDKSAVHPGCAGFDSVKSGFDSVKSGFAFAAGEVALMVNWFRFAAMCETLAESKVRGKGGRFRPGIGRPPCLAERLLAAGDRRPLRSARNGMGLSARLRGARHGQAAHPRRRHRLPQIHVDGWGGQSGHTFLPAPWRTCTGKLGSCHGCGIGRASPMPSTA
jgi:multiple sugar transport system substrate-binding protein